MEVIIAMLIGIVVSLLCISWALGVIFYRTKENNELLKTVYHGVRDVYANLLEIQNDLSEKEPELKVDYPDSGDLFNMVKNQANRRTASEKFKIGTKVIAMKGIHIGEVYTIEKIDLCWYEAILKPYKLPEGGDYMETLRVYLDDLENEFEPLEDEE